MQSDPLIILIFGTVITIYGLIRIIVVGFHFHKIKVSRNWPETTGTVTSAGLGYTFKGKGENLCAEIKYTYNVFDLEYQNAIKIEALMNTRSNAIKNIKKFPNGYIFPVRYNPNYPQEVVTNYDNENPILFAGYIIFLVIGVYIIMASIAPAK